MKNDTATGITTYIVNRFHIPLRQTLPQLIELANHLERTHAEVSGLPHGIPEILHTMCDGLIAHMDKEERVLFPLIESGQSQFLKAPIAQMEIEHNEHEKHLEELKQLTNNFIPPESASGSWVLLYSSLADFEKVLREHIGIENNLLFPRAMNALIP